MIHPTIGRKVWFRLNGAALPFDVFQVEQPLDATIVCVWNDRMVNLRITDHGGASHSVRNVTLQQPGDPTPPGFYCEWMPYQTGML